MKRSFLEYFIKRVYGWRTLIYIFFSYKLEFSRLFSSRGWIFYADLTSMNEILSDSYFLVLKWIQTKKTKFKRNRNAWRVCWWHGKTLEQMKRATFIYSDFQLHTQIEQREMGFRNVYRSGLAFANIHWNLMINDILNPKQIAINAFYLRCHRRRERINYNCIAMILNMGVGQTKESNARAIEFLNWIIEKEYSKNFVR